MKEKRGVISVKLKTEIMELIKDTCKWKKKFERQRNKEMHRWDQEHALKVFGGKLSEHFESYPSSSFPNSYNS